jgi:hypothetical protein
VGDKAGGSGQLPLFPLYVIAIYSLFNRYFTALLLGFLTGYRNLEGQRQFASKSAVFRLKNR